MMKKKDLMTVTNWKLEKIAASDTRNKELKMVAVAACDVAVELLIHVIAEAITKKGGGGKGHNRK